MLELGQPLHAFDASALSGAIVVRRARAGERLVTLDGQDRALDQTDLLITDDSGPIALAGVMGGGPTEITAGTTSIVLESAHFSSLTVARTARRHKLPSEASRRYERGVDPALAAAAAAEVAVRLLVELGGATAGPVTDAWLGGVRCRRSLSMRGGSGAWPVGRTPRTSSCDGWRTWAASSSWASSTRIRSTKARVAIVLRPALGPLLSVVPPTWRPDLTGPQPS